MLLPYRYRWLCHCSFVGVGVGTDFCFLEFFSATADWITARGDEEVETGVTVIVSIAEGTSVGVAVILYVTAGVRVIDTCFKAEEDVAVFEIIGAAAFVAAPCTLGW